MKHQIANLSQFFVILALFISLAVQDVYGQTVSIDPTPIESPAAGEQLPLNIKITGGMNVAAYELTVTFDPTALSYVSIVNGDYMPPGAFVAPAVVTNTSAQLTAFTIGTTSDGDGALATITFTVVEAKNSSIGLEAVITDSTATAITPLSVHGGVVTGPDTGDTGDNQIVNIPDPNLSAAVAITLDKSWSDPITTADMARLTHLDARNANVSNLTGLEYATHLTNLSLGDKHVEGEGWINSNSIKDLSPLAGLTNLAFLNLGQNNISDLSSIAGLTNLTLLDLGANSVSDISALEGLTNLTSLVLSEQSISDISALEGLTNLTSLDLGVNSVSDISALEGLTNLTLLDLVINSVSDISALEGLTNLTLLDLGVNSVSDISALEGLTNLTHLSLVINSISDISPLVANTGLGSGDQVLLNDNPLNYASIKTHIPVLQGRGVTVEFDNVITESVNILDPNLRAAIETALGKASGATITTADMATLTELTAQNANISNLTGLETATSLTRLDLGTEYVEEEGRYINSNSVSDLSPLAGLTNLTWLRLRNNSVSDISALAGLTNLTWLNLGGNLMISDISVLSGLTNLETLYLYGNSISDISALASLTNLTFLNLWFNSIADLSPLRGLINLTWLGLYNNLVSDISPLAALTNLTVLALSNYSTFIPASGLTHLTSININNNAISDISPVSGLTNLTALWLGGNTISDISVVASLTNLTSLDIRDNNLSNISPLSGLTNLVDLHLSGNVITDISPLGANTGLGSGDQVLLNDNPLNYASIKTHIPVLQGRGVDVSFDDQPSTAIVEYNLSIPAGISLIHVPLKVIAVDGVARTITSIADLYDALGGTDSVNYLITYDLQTQGWLSYLGVSGKGEAADKELTDDIGIIAVMKTAVSPRLSGNPLGTDGTSTITLNPGTNLVGVPLKDSRIDRVSDLFALDGIGGNVSVVIVWDNGDFKAVGQSGDDGDLPITGGQSFILTAQEAATVAISGEGWTNAPGTAAAPLVGNADAVPSILASRDLHSLTGTQVTDTTPVLALRGAIVDEGTGANRAGFRVIVKNLSTRSTITGMIGDEGNGYRLTVVDIEKGRAAQIGDILEVSVQSSDPLIGVEPLRYTVTVDDVKRSLIQLPELVTYEIPAETELLRNYPNPFNPETWIPYRLAEDAFVTLTIYDRVGRVVRTLEIGHQVAAVYESRSKAAYWDGRNALGEQVASGVYFYHLSAGGYSQTRRMIIVK